jgi:hypothetical protein
MSIERLKAIAASLRDQAKVSPRIIASKNTPKLKRMPKTSSIIMKQTSTTTQP